MKAPIIFIHFSNSSYLKYTLRSARLFNPDKRVILLGDPSNAHFGRKGIEHHCFEDYAEGEEIAVFERVFQFITGGDYLNEYKTKFFFRRWFIIYNFIRAQGIDRFWTFDSDNLILTALSLQEPKFGDYDCTEQCNGKCMNGLINNRGVVCGYVNKINELFQRESYLKERREHVSIYKRHIFNEMDAYMVYKEEEAVRSIALNTIIEGETFDHCVSSPDEMKMCPLVIRKKKRMKQIYTDGRGLLFTYHLPTKQFVKLNTANMSWQLPDFIYRRLLRQAERQLSNGAMPKATASLENQGSIKPVNMYEIPIVGKVRRIYRKLQKRFSLP